MMMACNKYSSLGYEEKPSLFLEFHGSEQHTQEQAQIVGDIFTDEGGLGFQWASDLEDRNKLWKARHNCLYAVMNMRPGTKQLSTDVCVPISRLTEVITDTKKDILDHGINAPVLGHVGDGNYHVTFLYDEQNEEEKQLIHKLSESIVRRALAVNGTCTGEHGVGVGKSKYLQQELGQGSLNVMKQIKAALDPLNLMNPGKVLPS